MLNAAMASNDINTSMLGPIHPNQEVLTEREKYWIQKLKAATDSRLKELAGKTEATREELELMAAKRFVIEEERIKNTEYGDNEIARPIWLAELPGLIEKLSWEEEQAKLKKNYEHTLSWNGAPYVYYKHECWHCKREFYSRSDRSRYCCYRCTNDAFIKRLKEEKERIRNHRICLYCNKEFSSKRAHTKYCSESHRVLACHVRKKAEEKANEERKKTDHAMWLEERKSLLWRGADKGMEE
jgi:hypothetical protein